MEGFVRSKKIKRKNCISISFSWVKNKRIKKDKITQIYISYLGTLQIINGKTKEASIFRIRRYISQYDADTQEFLHPKINQVLKKLKYDIQI